MSNMETIEDHKKAVKRAQSSRYYESHKGYCREYYLTHREKLREQQREWRQKNKEHIYAKARAKYAETHVRVRRSRYGVPTVAGKRIGMFLKAEDNECYEWLKKHYQKRRLRMKVKLLVNTFCSHDQYEMTKYPRSSYVPKPELPKGTVLEVAKTWSNYYGTYYRCPLPEGMDGVYSSPEYDIDINKAEIIKKK